jgi:hypothetical protein
MWLKHGENKTEGRTSRDTVPLIYESCRFLVTPCHYNDSFLVKIFKTTILSRNCQSVCYIFLIYSTPLYQLSYMKSICNMHEMCVHLNIHDLHDNISYTLRIFLTYRKEVSTYTFMTTYPTSKNIITFRKEVSTYTFMTTSPLRIILTYRKEVSTYTFMTTYPTTNNFNMQERGVHLHIHDHIPTKNNFNMQERGVHLYIHDHIFH